MATALVAAPAKTSGPVSGTGNLATNAVPCIVREGSDEDARQKETVLAGVEACDRGCHEDPEQRDDCADREPMTARDSIIDGQTGEPLHSMARQVCRQTEDGQIRGPVDLQRVRHSESTQPDRQSRLKRLAQSSGRPSTPE